MMSKSASEQHNKSRNDTYGRLSECHSPLTPLENSTVKAPRRIESAYGQFPVQEPVYANTQSLYDNILYPQSASKAARKSDDEDRKSCASQTQLTWTMATFSSFVDLENQSAIIPQPDPNTLYSIVQHYQPATTTSTSSETIEPSKRLSPDVSRPLTANMRVISSQSQVILRVRTQLNPQVSHFSLISSSPTWTRAVPRRTTNAHAVRRRRRTRSPWRNATVPFKLICPSRPTKICKRTGTYSCTTPLPRRSPRRRRPPDSRNRTTTITTTTASTSHVAS